MYKNVFILSLICFSLCILSLGCGDDTVIQSPTPTPTVVLPTVTPTSIPQSGITVKSTTVSGHAHDVFLILSDLSTPSAIGVTYTASTVNEHNHIVTLTKDELTNIYNGLEVSLVSSVINGHSHYWTFKAFKSVSSLSGGHTHFIMIQATDLTSPPDSGIAYDTSIDVEHKHSLSLTKIQLSGLNNGQTLTVTSSAVNGHSHDFVIKKPCNCN